MELSSLVVGGSEGLVDAPQWSRRWTVFGQLFGFAAIVSFGWADTREAEPPHLDREPSANEDPKSILVHQFAVGGISAREFAQQCAVLRPGIEREQESCRTAS